MEGHTYFKGVPQSRGELQILVLLLYAFACMCESVHMEVCASLVVSPLVLVSVSICFVEVLISIYKVQTTVLCVISIQQISRVPVIVLVIPLCCSLL